MKNLPEHARYITAVVLPFLLFALAAAGWLLLYERPLERSSAGCAGEEFTSREDAFYSVDASEADTMDIETSIWVHENYIEATHLSAAELLSGPPEQAPEEPPSDLYQARIKPGSRGEEPEQVVQNREPAPGEEDEAAGPADPGPAKTVSRHDTDLNPYVQEVISTYSGHYPYLLNNDYANYNGVTENLYYGGRLLARAHPSGNRASHCVGITFEVFFKAMRERNRRLGLPEDDFNGMTFDDLFDFLMTWYVACGDKRRSNIEAAVERYGLGKRVSSFEEARAGDFMDISRSNGTGHTVIFQEWIRDNSGRITGVRYWSSQGWGIGYDTEYFDTSGYGNVYAHQVYIARVLPVRQYRGFR